MHFPVIFQFYVINNSSKKAFNVRHREADSTRNPTAPSSDRPPSVDPSTKNRVAVPQNRLTRKTWTPNASNHCGGGVIARRRRRTAAGSRGWLSSCQVGFRQIIQRDEIFLTMGKSRRKVLDRPHGTHLAFNFTAC